MQDKNNLRRTQITQEKNTEYMKLQVESVSDYRYYSVENLPELVDADAHSSKKIDNMKMKPQSIYSIKFDLKNNA